MLHFFMESRESVGGKISNHYIPVMSMLMKTSIHAIESIVEGLLNQTGSQKGLLEEGMLELSFIK